MYKFKIGDRIISKDSGLEAVIFKVDVHHTMWVPLVEYGVLWDAHPQKGVCTYMAHDVDSLWEKIDSVADSVNLPRGSAGLSEDLDLELDKKKDGCDHKWVIVGFTHLKEVCYHCDIEKVHS